ncbi:hypothetical protein [Streptomyces sp. NPDC093109]|uniref:hypothetical protein n=1 Tax=Streptomyces sp. NPDC093109 TaxID=3154977 RepID=UPI00344BD5B0
MSLPQTAPPTEDDVPAQTYKELKAALTAVGLTFPALHRDGELFVLGSIQLRGAQRLTRVLKAARP